MSSTDSVKGSVPTGKKTLRPKDAASLLLVDRDSSAPRILMGKRHASLAFMPGVFVFPGGRADPTDGSMVATSELRSNDMQQLLASMGARATQRRARALGLCAIRETFEETGLRIGKEAPENICAVKSPDWAAFLESGYAPALDSLRYFARAVTPPGNVRRFDTRFFLTFRDHIPTLQEQEIVPSGELENIDWVPLNEIDDMALAPITRLILEEALALVRKSGSVLPENLPVVEYNRRPHGFVRKVI